MLLISDVKKLKEWNLIYNDDILKTVNSDSSSDETMSTDGSSLELSESCVSSDEMDTDWIYYKNSFPLPFIFSVGKSK